jgi:hypothetical protein
MQDRYVADVGDFGKYGLLRALAQGVPHLVVGVVWYLVDVHSVEGKEAERKDGKHDGYLYGKPAHQRTFAACDPWLYSVMQQMRQLPNRGVRMIEEGAVLPDSTRFFHEPVPGFGKGPYPGAVQQELRWHKRMTWHKAARTAVEACDLVFTDPDNGIRFLDRPLMTEKPSHKHSYWHELESYLEAGKSLVAYHHLGRHNDHQQQIGDCLRKIRELGYQAWAVHYRRGTSRAFVIVPACKEHELMLMDRCQRFVGLRWTAHAALIPEHVMIA